MILFQGCFLNTYYESKQNEFLEEMLYSNKGQLERQKLLSFGASTMNLSFNLKNNPINILDVSFLYLRGTCSKVTFQNFSTENYPNQCGSEA